MNDDFKAQLTALALEELPPGEREKLETAFAQARDAEVYLRETREFCQLLTQTLASPAEAELTETQREELARQLAQPSALAEDSSKVVAFPQSKRRVWLGWTAAAAAVLAVLASISVPKFANVSSPSARAFPAALRENAAVASNGRPAPDTPTEGFDYKYNQAQELAENGRYDDARQKLDELVASNESDGRAQKLLERLNDAEYYNPATSEEHKAKVAQVKESLQKAAEYADLGDYEKAKQGYNETLQIDGYNTTARRGLEKVEGQQLESLLTSRDHARAKMLREGDEKWETSAAAPPASTPGEPIQLAAAPAASAALDATATAATPAGPVPLDRKPPVSFAPEKMAPSAGMFGALPALSEKQDGYAIGRDATPQQPNTEAYAEIPENPFVAVASEPLSTFSIDVDTASYANVRRFLNQGQRPPRAAVRLEELVNYFKYTYPQPEAGKPFSVTVEMTECPWQPQHRLARIGLQGKDVAREERPAANLVFLIDVSGSMDAPNKLPLVKQSLHLLTEQLKGSDHVALVTYASGTGVALPSTSLEQKDTVRRAIDSLTAGGSTNGASGLQLAYQQARQHFKKDGVNRVILATDGDFNVGITSQGDLQKLITDEAKSGVFLSVLGYGMGNLKDATMELLADKGNGNYAYIDSLGEARKVLADQVQGTLVTIAKDVKIQIEFNPAVVRNYRLLGYENRMLAKEDFNDDKKDAGEIGAGHTVTALYEIVPMSAPALQPPVDALKYQQPQRITVTRTTAEESDSDKSATATSPNETMTVKLRYKQPDGDVSQLIEVPVVDNADATFAEAPGDFKFAASVAMYGLLLKDSAHKGSANWNMVRDFARAGKGSDPEGYRGEFLQLVEKAAGVAP